MVLGLLFSNTSFAENVYDFLKKDTEWVGSSWYMNFHNNHGSKTIMVERIEVMFDDCDNVTSSATADRIYKVNAYVKPYSGKRTLITSNLPTDDEFCFYAYASFNESTSSTSTFKKKKKKESGFKWWYLFFIPVGLAIIGAIFGENKQGSKSKIASGENFIVDVWEGKKSLGESFWLYFVVINGVISFGSGYFAEINDNNIFLVAALASNIWAGVGTWNSSTNYQLTKIKKKKPHGWAYAAKVVIVLNFLSLGGQLILLFNT